MPNPILFFIIIIVVDLILKSVKDKKKIEESKQPMPKRQETMPGGELREVLNRELKKQRELAQSKVDRRLVENKDKVDRRLVEDKDKLDRRITDKRDRTNQGINREYKSRTETNQRRQTANNMTRTRTKMEDKDKVREKQPELDISNNLLMGIIFSEILSEPKAIENQRRSL